MQIGVTGQYIFTYLANNIPTNIMNNGSTLLAKHLAMDNVMLFPWYTFKNKLAETSP